MDSKLFFVLVLLSGFLLSCKTSNVSSEGADFQFPVDRDAYRTIDVKEFLSRIRLMPIRDARSCMDIYFLTETQEEGKQEIVFTQHKINDQFYWISKMATGMLDDSVEGKSVVMKAEIVEGIWTIREIYESIRCYRGRGHTEWGKEPCI